MASATMSEEAAGRTRPAKKVVAHRFTPPGATSTTTPAGIAMHDPDVVMEDGGSRIEDEGNSPQSSIPNPRSHESPAALPVTVAASIAMIDLHPANPRIHYPEGEIAELAESIRANGLLQPITLRPSPADKRRYQLVCGHRRLMACRQLKLKSIAAHVKHLDDVATLRAIAAENHARKDLNPIERARLVETLTKPAAEGGGGLSDDEAAAQFGMASRSWAANVKRLLKLPEPWRGRLVSGEIEETKARALLPYLAAPRVLAAIDQDWSDPLGYLRTASRDEFTDEVERIVANNTFVVGDRDKHQWYRNGKGPWDHVPCYVDLEAHREKLEIVTLPIREGYGKRAKSVQRECVTNMDLLCKLQWAEMKKREGKKSAAADKREAKAKQAKRELTPAEQKAKAERDRHILAERIKHWKLAVKRFVIGDTLRDLKYGVGNPIFRIALVWAFNAGSHGHQAASLREGIRAAGDAARCDPFRIAGTIGRLHSPEMVQQAAAAEYFWPLKVGDAYALTERHVPRELVEALWDEFGFDIVLTWSAMQNDQPAGAALLLRKFLDLHNVGQLRTLAAAWDVHVPDSATKAAGIRLIEAKLTERRLPLPACLKERAATKRKPARKK